MSLKIDVHKKDHGYYVISLEGRLGSDTYISLEEKLKPILKEATNVLMLDLKHLEYISSAGLGVVFQAKK